MNQVKLKNLVDSAITLHREIATKTEQLKSLKQILIKEADLHPEALVDIGNGGKRWTAQGRDGSIARVNFPAPGIISQVEAGSGELKEIKDIVGKKFHLLFDTVETYKPVDEFRAQASQLLPGPKLEELMSICEKENAPRVSFETAKNSSNAATV
jgi:hypothetical protein